MVSGHRDIVDDHDRVVYRNRGWRRASGVYTGAEVVRATVRAGTNLVGEPSAVLCRRDEFEAAGGFDRTYAYMIDLEAWMRLLERGSLHYLPDSLCTFRVSQTSWSAQLRRDQARQARELLRTLQRRHPETVTRTDLAIGLTKPTLLAAARRAVFAASAVLPNRGAAAHAIGDPVDPVDASWRTRSRPRAGYSRHPITAGPKRGVYAPTMRAPEPRRTGAEDLRCSLMCRARKPDELRVR